MVSDGLLVSFAETHGQTFLSDKSLNFIAIFSKDIREAENYLSVIYRAKKKAESSEKFVLVGEDIQEEIDLNLRKVFQMLKTDRKIKDRDSYLFMSFYNFFLEQIFIKNSKKESKFPSVVLHNFLREE